VIIAGDFNTSKFPLTAENGKAIIGSNTNLNDRGETDHCDHMIMNEQWHKGFVPNYKKAVAKRIDACLFSVSSMIIDNSFSAASTSSASLNPKM
jgi:hypothetical protein